MEEGGGTTDKDAEIVRGPVGGEFVVIPEQSCDCVFS